MLNSCEGYTMSEIYTNAHDWAAVHTTTTVRIVSQAKTVYTTGNNTTVATHKYIEGKLGVRVYTTYVVYDHRAHLYEGRSSTIDLNG